MKTIVRQGLEWLLTRSPDLLNKLADGPVQIDGQTLCPGAAVLCRLDALMPRSPKRSPGFARRHLRLVNGLIAPAPRPMQSTEDLRVDLPGRTCDARLYTPKGAEKDGPCLLYFHGGGFVVGSVDEYDPVVRTIADYAKIKVASIEYRLAPEFPFPHGIEDGLHTFLWFQQHAARLGIDPQRILVGGDSAGGNIAAVAAMLCRDRGLDTPAGQWLVYPILNQKRDSVSHRLFREGLWLNTERLDYFEKHYLPSPELKNDVRASPLLMESFEGLPPTAIATAFFDPLRDDGQLLCAKLSEAGGWARYHCCVDQFHGYMNTDVLPSARRARDASLQLLVELLAEVDKRQMTA